MEEKNIGEDAFYNAYGGNGGKVSVKKIAMMPKFIAKTGTTGGMISTGTGSGMISTGNGTTGIGVHNPTTEQRTTTGQGAILKTVNLVDLSSKLMPKTSPTITTNQTPVIPSPTPDLTGGTGGGGGGGGGGTDGGGGIEQEQEEEQPQEETEDPILDDQNYGIDLGADDLFEEQVSPTEEQVSPTEEKAPTGQIKESTADFNPMGSSVVEKVSAPATEKKGLLDSLNITSGELAFVAGIVITAIIVKSIIYKS